MGANPFLLQGRERGEWWEREGGMGRGKLDIMRSSESWYSELKNKDGCASVRSKRGKTVHGK